jgi:hypothetical protein
MVDIIAVTYGQNEILKCFINSIKSQTSNKWRLILIHDGPNPNLREELINENYLNDSKIEFYEYSSRTENYGHILRKWGVENHIKNEYVLITNGDNYYIPNMIEEVLKRNEDFIYFDLVHSHKNPRNHNKSTYGYMDTKLSCSNIDMGCVVIKSDLAKKTGFNHISFDADWKYFEEILKTDPTTYKIDKILFVHN